MFNLCLLILASKIVAELNYPTKEACAFYQTLAKLEIFEYTCFSYKVIDEHENIITVRCNSTMVFSPTDGHCVRPIDNKWPCDVALDCTNSPDHKYADVAEGCNTYYTCQGGVFFGHSYCPGATIFNEKMQYCDWKYNVDPPCGTMDPSLIVG